MSQPERMGAEFALVGFFTFVGDDPSATLREFEEIPREKIHALEEAIRETFSRTIRSRWCSIRRWFRWTMRRRPSGISTGFWKPG